MEHAPRKVYQGEDDYRGLSIASHNTTLSVFPNFLLLMSD